MSKYQPLSELLSRQGTKEVRLPFQVIEEALGFPLPASARNYPAWWSNHEGSHVQARAWLGAGWCTQEVDLRGQRVMFTRRRTPQKLPGNTATPSKDRRIFLDLDLLSPAGRKLFDEYNAEQGGDSAAALVRAIHEAAMAKRGRIIDDIVARAVKMPAGAQSAVDMVREDRNRDVH